jgi:D-glycero-D-manno-heptose 1,7-bisphosphate phosphatase
MKVVFLDRDGVINKEVGYLHNDKDFIFIDGVFQTCKKLISYGYHLIIVTNQSGIARGYYSETDFKVLNNWMLKKFLQQEIEFLDVLFCPHDPSSSCMCRKPKPGMFLKAKKLYNIDMQNSWIIGDKNEDILAAKSAGINNTIIVKSGHPVDERTTNAKYVLKSIADCPEVIKL